MSWHVYYWKAANQIVIGDKFGLVQLLGNTGAYFIRICPRSRIPKTLEYLGEL